MVVSEDEKVVTDESRGFDETTLQKIWDFMYPPEKPVPVPEKTQMEQWQKYYENGEYLRSAEMTEYNMIDGRLNNISGKKQAKQKERTSVLEKLHRKQKEIAIRSGKQPEQVMGADKERNRK